jgi:hypothetical protein
VKTVALLLVLLLKTCWAAWAQVVQLLCLAEWTGGRFFKGFPFKIEDFWSVA